MITKPLSETLRSVKTRMFPQRHQAVKRPFYATIGIGGNVGDVVRRFEHLLLAIDRDSRISWHQSSKILINPAFGYRDQPDFFNAVVTLSTNLRAVELLRVLLRLEERFGRKRSFKNAPRTLDIDIIFFNGQKVNKKDLVIPHPFWKARDSVILPLSDLGRRA